MNIKSKILGFTAKQELTDFVHEKVEKLSQFYDKIISRYAYGQKSQALKKTNFVIYD